MSDAIEYLSRRVRRYKNLTEAAAALGIQYHTLYAILRGNRSIGDKTIRNMLKADPTLSEQKLRMIRAKP
jgi:plasmid maintenance system antidote protein VapI